MNATVQQLLGSNADTKAKVEEFKSCLARAKGAPQQQELVAAVLTNLALDPTSAIQCLATCFLKAREALEEQLRAGDRLAAALHSAGDKAKAVANLAVAQPVKASAGSVGGGASSLWPTLARLQGVPNWQFLPPGPVREAAVYIWSKRPEYAPPTGSSAVLVRWLAQPDTPVTEKPHLLSSVQQAWREKQVNIGTQVEEVLEAVLQDIGAPSSTPEWLAHAAMTRPAKAHTSTWLCPLLPVLVDAITGAAAGLLGDASGPPAVFFAWAGLYGAVLHWLCGAGAAAAANDKVASVASAVEAALPAVLRLLKEVVLLLARKRCVLELAACSLCIVLHWHVVVTGLDEASSTLILEWVVFCRHMLVDLPGDHPEVRLGELTGRIFSAIPRAAAEDAIVMSPVDHLAAELHASMGSCISVGVQAGLSNLGNTCYLNSFLQALTLTEDLVIGLGALYPPLLAVSNNSNNCTSSMPMSTTSSIANPGSQEVHRSAPGPAPATSTAAKVVQKCLAKLLVCLLVSKQRLVAPKELAKLTPFGLDGRQQDATELARWLLEQLGDAACPTSLTARCFGGSACTRVWCTSCQHEQEKLESFSDLCLPLVVGENGSSPPVGSGATVAELLKAFLSPEELPGYRCDGCNAVGTSQHRYEIRAAPRHLLVTLNRFAFTAAGGQHKLDAHVSADKRLQLPLGTNSNSKGGGPTMVAEYSLYAIVTHIGSTPHSGHYICLGRRSGDEDSTWRVYDDASVSAIPDAGQEELDRRANGNATAYLLLYVQTTPAMDCSQPLQLPAGFFAEAVLSDVHEQGKASSSEAGGASAFPAMPPAAPPPPGSHGGAGSGMPGLGSGGGGGGGSWVC